MSGFDIELCNESDFKSQQNILYWSCYYLLKGIPGDWVFSRFTLTVEEATGHEISYICFIDMDNEDRSFTMKWDNGDTPFHIAHIEVSNA